MYNYQLFGYYQASCFFFILNNVMETGLCLSSSKKPTLLGPIDNELELQNIVINKNKALHNVQKVNKCINIPSSS